jgi:hypothetical protein
MKIKLLLPAALMLTFRMIGSTMTAGLLLFGCAPRPAFYFLPAAGNFSQEQPVQNAAGDNFMAQATLPGASALAGSVTHTTANASNSSPAAPTKAFPLAAAVAPGPAARPVPGQSVRVDIRQSVLLRKGRTRVTGEQPVLGTARLGFIFSLIGAGLLVVALAVTPPLILLTFLSALFGVITSRIALAKIRKNPNQYSGRGLARAGFIIGFLLVAVFVVFLLYLLAFAGAF